MRHRAKWTVAGILLFVIAGPVWAGATNPEDFGSYGLFDTGEWEPTPAVEGFELVAEQDWNPSYSENNLFNIRDVGPDSGSGQDLALETFGAGNAATFSSVSPDIVTSPHQMLSLDFRMADGTVDQDRTRLIVNRGVGTQTQAMGINRRYQYNSAQIVLDTISDFVVGEVFAALSAPPFQSYAETADLPTGFLLKDDFQGDTAPWFTLQLESDYDMPQTGQFTGLLGQSRARLMKQDGSEDYGWSDWLNMGNNNTQPERVHIIGNGTIQYDNLSVAPVGGAMPCDFTSSNTCDDADIDLLTAAVRNGTSDSQFNVDGLGDPNIPDNADFDFYITDNSMLSTGHGDADLNMIVNFVDFVNLSNDFGNTGTGWARGNFNTDDNTNFNDFVALSNNFGTSFVSGSNVPEPAMLCTLGFLSLVLARGRFSKQCSSTLRGEAKDTHRQDQC